jgi:hypothetical protein
LESFSARSTIPQTILLLKWRNNGNSYRTDTFLHII